MSNNINYSIFRELHTQKIPSIATIEDNSPAITRCIWAQSLSRYSSSHGLSSSFAHSMRASHIFWTVEMASSGTSGISSCVDMIRALTEAITHGNSGFGVPILLKVFSCSMRAQSINFSAYSRCDHGMRLSRKKSVVCPARIVLTQKPQFVCQRVSTGNEESLFIRKKLESKRVIEIGMKKYNLAVVWFEIRTVSCVERLSAKIDNQIRLLLRGWFLHVFIMCCYAHLKYISRTKLMAKNMPRNCFTDIMQDMLYIFWFARKFWCNARFDVLKIESHKKTKKSPGRVTRGVELRRNEKLPGHKSEQVHHRWCESDSHRGNYRIIFYWSMMTNQLSLLLYRARWGHLRKIC